MCNAIISWYHGTLTNKADEFAIYWRTWVYLDEVCKDVDFSSKSIVIWRRIYAPVSLIAFIQAKPYYLLDVTQANING